MPPRRILFVVEGRKTESASVIKAFARVMEANNEEINICKYSANIYSLYDSFANGEYDSFIDYLWVNKKDLFPEGIKPSDYFSSIYLIFDFDPQDPKFSIEKCLWLLGKFTDETEDGKLYFNYPMVESMFDFVNFNQKSFNGRTVSRIGLSSKTYKDRVNTKSLIKGKKLFNINDNKILYKLIYLHINKYRYLTSEENKYFLSDQILLFKIQKDYMSKNKVSIINSSLLIISDYNVDMLELLKKK